jgi:uncharacterized membrane protein
VDNPGTHIDFGTIRLIVQDHFPVHIQLNISGVIAISISVARSISPVFSYPEQRRMCVPMDDLIWVPGIIAIIVLFLGGIVVLLFFWKRKQEEIHTGGGPPADLYTRYQKGEITSEQYEMMNKDIQEHSPETIAEKFFRYF